MLKRLGNFLYRFIFVDQKKGHLSHTKFWSHIGYAVVTWAFIYAQLHNLPLPTDLYFFIGSVLIGNRTIMQGLEIIKRTPGTNPVQKTEILPESMLPMSGPLMSEPKKKK
jgi:hypothetical protein